MTLIDLSGEFTDPFADVLLAWDSDEPPIPRDAVGEVEGFSARAITFAGHSGWELCRTLGAGENVYGSGESFLSLDLRGRRRVLINRETNGAKGIDASYISAPFFWSSRGWGLFVDTGAPVFADVGHRDPHLLRLVVLDPQLSTHTFRGSGAQILADYTALTGRCHEWPDWALGVWMSRATYLSASEMHDVLSDLKSAGCPVDVMHVDAWMTGNVFRTFTTNWQVDRQRFPRGWTQRLRDAGVKVSMWLNPFVLANTELAESLGSLGLLLRDANGGLAVTSDRDYRNIIDFTNPAAVHWWQQTVRELIASECPDALKLDFGEEIPRTALTHDGRPGVVVRNSYALLYQRATAAAVGPMPLFCRSGTAGSQSTPCHWVGDTVSDWSGLAEALNGCLSLAMSGFGLVTADAGGFHADDTGHIPAVLLDGGQAHYRADVEPELFGRWAQWAAFSPVTRFHGVGVREPTAYPEPWRSCAIGALRARREILPDLRRALAAARVTGMPLMRPMALAFPDHPQASAADTQYLLGDELLVAPLLERGGKRLMWFPPGRWQPLMGDIPTRPGWCQVTCRPHEFPVFRRALD